MLRKSILTARKRLPRNSQKRLGAAVVEFAIVAPVLVFATMGMIEVTRGVQVKHVLTDAARSACRLAIQPNSTNSSVAANANDILTDNGLKSSDATVTIQITKANGSTSTDLSKAVQGDKISVNISVPVSKIGWISPIFLSGNKVESGTLYMMRQR